MCFEDGTPSVYNDDGLTKLVSDVATDLLGADNVTAMPRPSMGSEDFAAYLEHVPGTMFRLGAAGDDGRRGRDCTRRRSTWTSGVWRWARRYWRGAWWKWSKPKL